MDIRITSINPNTPADIVEPCRACCYWECPERFTKGRHTEKEARLKAQWFEKMARQFDPCGKLLYADGEPVAYCQYASPEHFPGLSGYPGLAAHLDKNGIFISCLYVSPTHQRKGLGGRLLREVIDELKGRSFSAIETFARDDSANNCSGPTGFYLARGFNVIATETFPNGASLSLVRLDLGVSAPPDRTRRG